MLTDQNFKDLEDKGYTVVPGVLSAADCDKYIQHYNQWLTIFGKKWPKSNKGLIRGYNSGHLDPTWRVRLQAKDVFSQIWKTEKLMTSFDSIAIGRPPEDGAEPFNDDSTHWLHLDQEGMREGLHAYQGAVNLEESLEDDWTLQVMENSHKVFQKFFKENTNADPKKQFFRLNQTQVKYFLSNECEIKRVPVPKGGMVLWDSRVVHANAQPKSGRANPGRWRYVVFVSMTPAVWATSADLAVKVEAYEGAKMTNHWSSDGCKLTRESSASQACEKKLPDIAKTLEAQQLAGVAPYDFKDGSPNGPPPPVTILSHKTIAKRKQHGKSKSKGATGTG